MRILLSFGLLCMFLLKDVQAQSGMETIWATPKYPAFSTGIDSRAPALPSKPDTLPSRAGLVPFLKEHIHGSAQVEYVYRSGNYPGQVKPEHVFRYRLDPSISIGGLPLRFSLGYSSDYKGNIGSIYQVRFSIDTRKYLENIQAKGIKEIQDEWLASDSLRDIFQYELDSLPVQDTLLSRYKEYDLCLDTLQEILPERPDLQGFSDSIWRMRYRTEVDMERFKELKFRIDSLQKLREQYRIDKEEWTKQSRSFKNHDLDTLKGMTRFIGGFKQLSIGSFSLNYGKYFASGGQYLGVHTEYQVRYLALIAFVGNSRQNQRFIQDFTRKENPAATFGFVGAGLRLGKGNNHIQSVYTQGKRSRKSRTEEGFFPFPEKNSVWANSFEKRLYTEGELYGEWNYSRSENPPKGLSSELPASSLSVPILNTSALLVGVKGTLDENRVGYDLSFSQIGGDYYSFALPYLRTDIRAGEFSLNRNFWRSRVKWKGSVNLSADNVSRKKAYTTNTEKYLNTVQLEVPDLPKIIVSHTWVNQNTQTNESTTDYSSKISAGAITATQVIKIKEDLLYTYSLTWINTAVFNGQGNSYYSNTLTTQHMLMSARVNLACMVQATHYNRQWTGLSPSILAGTQIKKFTLTAGGGLLFNPQTNNHRMDISGKLGWLLSKNIRLEAGYQHMRFLLAETQLSIGNLMIHYLW